MSRPLSAGMAAACALAISFAPARADTNQELYEKAKAEGGIVNFFGGGQAETNERWIREFEKQFPGVKINYTGGFSNVFNQEINKQVAAKSVQVDLVSLQTVQDFHEWQKRGVLMAFKHEGFEQVNPAYRDPDGYFTTIQVNQMSYGYNTKLVKVEDVPKGAKDFLDPKWKGKLVFTYPHDDDTTLFLFEMLADKYGWNYILDVMKQEPKFVQGHLGVSKAIASGEALVSFDVTSSADNLRRAGQPIARAYSMEDETPVTTLTMGILKDAPHPNGAKLYMNWLMAKEQQGRSLNYSARMDVGPPAEFPDLKTIKVNTNYIPFLSSEEKLVKLRAKYEQLIGPVKNTGGVK